MLAFTAAWLVGIGGCDLLAWMGSRFEGPFRLAAGLWMLLVGVVVWRKYFSGSINVFSANRWWLGLIILLALLLHPILGGQPPIHFEFSRSSPIYFLWCVLVIGFGEELWWRGIWFEMWKAKPLICILGGSIAFTAYHFPFQGFEMMIGEGLSIRIFFLGLLFAAARYQGTSIGTLALAHGLIDWLQGSIQWSRWNGPVPFVVCCVVLTAIILGSRPKEAQKVLSLL